MPKWEVRTTSDQFANEVTADVIDTTEHFVDFVRHTGTEDKLIVLRVPTKGVVWIKLME